MLYTFARVDAVLQMNVCDYFTHGRRGRVRLHEKGGTGRMPRWRQSSGRPDR